MPGKSPTILLTLICVAIAGSVAGDTPVELAKVEKVTIRAAEGWEDAQPEIVHFRDDFFMEASDWNVSADQATLYGKLDDPETVILSGSPARIRVKAWFNDQPETVSGEARRISWQREQKLIRLEGQARLGRGANRMSGGVIEYEIDSDRFQAGGRGGVRIRAWPDNDSGPQEPGPEKN